MFNAYSPVLMGKCNIYLMDELEKYAGKSNELSSHKLVSFNCHILKLVGKSYD